jgi:phosphoadenosine phosphosulfate reductase
MARRRGREIEFARWPGYKRQWARAFRLLWEMRDSRPGIAKFASLEAMWEWWMSDERMPAADECQLDMWSE